MKWFPFPILAILAILATLGSLPQAKADDVAYLVNVTVGPGLRFSSAGEALDYGRRICGHVEKNQSYADNIASIKADLATDNYQAAYLINQAVNELCPALIWQLRRSAVGYTD